jgi:hypothetical protein
VFAVGLLAAGTGFIVSGRALAPADTSNARTFRTDPSCTAPLTGAAPSGACSVVAAKVLVAGMRRTGGLSRTHGNTPFVYLHFADGSPHQDDLEGSAGRDFAESVRPGAPARVQLFRGTMVRVASGSSSAETISAPDVSARTDSEMPWVGAVLMVIGGLFAFGGIRSMRRAGSVTPLP